mgnify:CR=1 FL=1
MAAPATPTSDRAFVITRTLNAPRALVWKAWSEADHLAKWWGPKGCAIRIGRLELRPGGIFHYAMEFSSGSAMWGRFFYREIEAPGRIVWLNSFSDRHGGLTRAPFAGAWPLEMANTMTLGEREGRTTLTLHSVPFGATEEERAFFEGCFDSLNQGFGGTFEQLDNYLGSLRGGGGKSTKPA